MTAFGDRTHQTLAWFTHVAQPIRNERPMIANRFALVRAALVAMTFGLPFSRQHNLNLPGRRRPRSAWWIGNRSRTIRSLPEPDRTPGTARFASVALS